ncbi:helix-turn-helix domain-containing protein [Hyphomicrobium sp.]|jgi:AraC family transcriptional activator of mtrCDE|uniref:helix-turn-helix domain-containing protein n=1 Tax=Hyphomicrobium sp. TaxID=82 RepID=UPI00356758FE
MVAERPKLPVSTRDIDQLMIGLEVQMGGLAHCIINPGWRLAFTAGQKTAIHYVVRGHGTMTVAEFPPIELAPHSMVIVPSMLPVRVEITRPVPSNTKCFDVSQLEQGKIDEIVAGSGGPELILMCGYFESSYGRSIDIFTTLTAPIVEQFDPADRLDQSLAAVLNETASERVGRAAMIGSLLKQVIVSVLRRSFEEPGLWTQRFPIMNDPQIARAFASMIADPCESHTTNTLARVAGLSRSAFMSRFSEALGVSPLAALRELRMRRAANLLDAKMMSVEQVASAVGYVNRSSFSRAFRAIYGVDPTDYRAGSRRAGDDMWIVEDESSSVEP